MQTQILIKQALESPYLGPYAASTLQLATSDLFSFAAIIPAYVWCTKSQKSDAKRGLFRRKIIVSLKNPRDTFFLQTASNISMQL